MDKKHNQLQKKLGVMFIGLNGAVANTVITGIHSQPDLDYLDINLVNSKAKVDISQLKKLGSIIENGFFKDSQWIREENFVFGGWDVFYSNTFERAKYHKIIPSEFYKNNKEILSSIVPMKGYVNKWDTLDAQNSSYCHKMGEFSNFMEVVNKIREDIVNFKVSNNLSEVIVVYLGLPLKTESVNGLDLFALKNKEAHIDLDYLSKLSGDSLPSSVAYAIAAILEKAPFIDFTPNITLQLPFIERLAIDNGVPIAGMDGNTGQTLMKTLIAPMLKIRNFKLIGWYSTNILGNSDGKTLSLEEHRKLKMEDKLSVLEPILEYSNFDHVVDISFYGVRYDNKEAWDNIDFLGFLGLPMNVKINWIGRDSILAAPLVIDLIKHCEFSLRVGEAGLQEHLAIYFKHPLKSFYKQNSLPYNKHYNNDKLVLSFFDAFYLLVQFYQKYTPFSLTY